MFRTTQRHVERDFKSIQATSSDLGKRAVSEGVDAEEAINSIDAMISSVENLKRKVGALLLAASSEIHLE